MCPPKSTHQRKAFYEAKLKEILAKLKLGLTMQDRYTRQITESVDKSLRVDRVWVEQSHQRLLEESKKLFPYLLEDPMVEQASLKFARAFFTVRRKTYLKRMRRHERRNVNRITEKADPAVAIKAGPSLPAVSRRRQSQSNAGPSIITAQPRAAKLSISASFIASTYMERVLRYNNEPSLQLYQSKNKSPPEPELVSIDQTRSNIHSAPATPPDTSLIESRAVPAGASQIHFHNDTQVPNVNILRVSKAVAVSETNSYINCNERIKSGIEEVRSFLENCSPSMVHHFDSFIKAGVKDGEYLKAVGRLCASGTKALSMVLGPNLSIIDSILLQKYLLAWSKEGTQERERSAQC